MEMPLDYAAFCTATERWLAEAATLDPALAAALDLLRGHSPHSEAHAALGTHTLDSLWETCTTGELEPV
jgi:hypothetical protein